MSFGFERPLVAIAAFIVLPVIIAAARRLKNPFRLIIPLGAPGGIPFKAPHNIEWLIKTLKFLEYTGVLVLLLCAAGPQITTRRVVYLNRGADILFIIDTSPSMAALDMNGESRFNAARNLITGFATKRPNDGIGLAAVGSDAALLVPVTTDRGVLYNRLEQLRIGEFGDGTALGNGLAAAAFHLEKSSAPRKVAVLITDGENNAGTIHPETAAAMLPGLGISLWLIGIGSGGEVPIDYIDPQTRMRRTGTFDSRFDLENLIKICRAGEGDWLYAPSAQALDESFRHIDDREMIVRRSSIVSHQHSCRMPFMLIAFCLLTAIRYFRRIFLGAFA